MQWISVRPATLRDTLPRLDLGKVKRLYATVLLSSEVVHNYDLSLKLIETVSSWFLYIIYVF